MSSDTVVPNINNRYETQKLYLTLLPFSIYDNPSKQYSRKVKLKRTQSLSTSSSSATTELTIMPSYLVSGAAAAAAAVNAPALPLPRNGGVKLRKK